MGATMFGATSIKAAEQPGNRRRDNLAIVYQNLLTVIARLRANRQVINDAQAFRVQMQSALRAAEKEGIGKLYPPEDVRLATFAIVAFLDESILNSTNPAFSDWPRMPIPTAPPICSKSIRSAFFSATRGSTGSASRIRCALCSMASLKKSAEFAGPCRGSLPLGPFRKAQ